MDAWAENQGVDQSAAGLLTMMGDPSGALTRSLGMVLNHPGPMAVLGYERCKRFALYLVDGVVKVASPRQVERIAEASDDPAGDDRPDVTLAPAMIEAIKAFGKDEL